MSGGCSPTRPPRRRSPSTAPPGATASATGCWRPRCSESPCRRSSFGRPHLADDPHPEHAGQEFVFVHAGRVELGYGDQTIKLGTGDSAYFDASVSHKIRAVGAEPAGVVVISQTEPR
jgi:mannose-6-phosphate isomerase-like protein (cupin superfamily)